MVAMSIVVYLHVVLGEMVPKNIALAGPDRAALVLSPPMMVIVMLLRPFIIVLNLSANGILRLLGVEPKDEVSSSYTREEVAALVEESRGEGMIAADEYDRLAGALGFTEKAVTSVLMPVEGLTTVHTRLHRRPTSRRLCAATGYSRFPVTDDDGDAAGLPAHQGRPRERRGSVASARSTTSGCARSPRSVPDDVLHEALESLQRRGAHMARVVDPRRSGARAGHPRGRARGARRRDPRRLAPRVGRKHGRGWIG